MFGTIPIMCAAALSFFYSGIVTDIQQSQMGRLATFPVPVPNDYQLIATPDIWNTSVRFEPYGEKGSPSSTLHLFEAGSMRWRIGQRVMIQINACQDDGMLSALRSWNAFAPGYAN